MKKNIIVLGFAFLSMCSHFAISQTADFSVDQGDSVCFNEAVTFTDLSSGPVNIVSWSWTITSPCVAVPVIPNPNAQDPGTICFSEPCSYLIELQIVDANGINASANVQLSVWDCPGSLIAGFTSDSTICMNGCITMNDTSQGAPTGWEWTVSPITAAIPSSSTQQNPSFCFVDANSNNPVEVSLVVSNADGNSCKYTKQIEVFSNPVVTGSIGISAGASKDTIITAGNPAILNAMSIGASAYLWEPSTSVTNPSVLTTFANPSETTIYTITASNGNGCSAKDSVIVYVNSNALIDVPTAFSPNGDGKNDLLVVKGLGLTKCIFKVYNRYGILVFESTIQKHGWDGNFKGEKENPGVFHWTLDYEFSSGEGGIRSGNTTLIR